MYYAHVNEHGQYQTVEDHLKGTAVRCAAFAAEFGEEQRGWLMGQMHDIGKCSKEFQRRLLENGPKVDHATAGGLECDRMGEGLVACCIVGHHGGLLDYGSKGDVTGAPTFVGRIKKAAAGKIPKYEWNNVLPRLERKPKITDTYSWALWIKMLYSSLVDADYLDTEAFMQNGTVQREQYESLPVLLERLEKHIQSWFPPKTELNQTRCEILNACLGAGVRQRGLYSLTVPTGGGKTISSLAFALKHAIANGMKRVIYVVPYTSIIEQNAQVFREILGDNNVIEHHCAVVADEEAETGANNQRLRLATENWNAPVVVTTSVQFFESFYSNRPSKCRKLHNVANSVVIFDEAQMLPREHLRPCVGVIANLVKHFRATAVLCTATQPVLNNLIQSFGSDLHVEELVPGTKKLFSKLRRTTYRKIGSVNWEILSKTLGAYSQVLCIVNTRKAAQLIYEKLPQEGRYHLSTLMYPANRKTVLEEIRRRLKAGEVCRVVATSLIEAGVDIDFPMVYRELAGLDSIAQAAGRCNREGKRAAEESFVTVFESEEMPPKLQTINIAAMRETLTSGLEFDDPACMQYYFEKWLSLSDEKLDVSDAVRKLRGGSNGCLFPFDTVAREFHLIAQNTKTIYIPDGEGAELCQQLLDKTANRMIYRRAGVYGVNVYDQQFQELYDMGFLTLLDEESAVLTTMSRYNRETGLSLNGVSGEAFFV